MKVGRGLVDRGKQVPEPRVHHLRVGFKFSLGLHQNESTSRDSKVLVDSPTMAVVRPFKGLRYTEKAGPLDLLVAPPYDVISPAEREQFASRNPHNVVYLTLPESQPDDRSKFVKYARSAAALSEWRREGVLEPEAKPAFYRYVQTFHIPRVPETFTRTSMIALIKTEPYDKGVVLPHEQTFPKHKEDRMRILEATRAHLECIFGLYEDPNGEVLRTLDDAAADGAVVLRSDEGVDHRLEPITDAATCEKLAGLIADKKVWIADGHHRYETACAFRAALGERDGLVPEDFMMMALSSMSDPGLVLLPTHRVVSKLPYDKGELLRRLGEHFKVEEHHTSRLMDLIEDKAAKGVRAFGMAIGGGVGYVLTAYNQQDIHDLVGDVGTDELKSLDVTVLHRVILEKILGIEGLDQISYTRDPYEAIANVEEGDAVSFLMNPPTVDDMRTIALGGELMPQKSTYYYPKILSGLVLWSLNDF